MKSTKKYCCPECVLQSPTGHTLRYCTGGQVYSSEHFHFFGADVIVSGSHDRSYTNHTARYRVRALFPRVGHNGS